MSDGRATYGGHATPAQLGDDICDDDVVLEACSGDREHLPLK
jgi:hypothetical protein